MAIIISKDELQELLNLTEKAQNTPVMAMSVEDGLEGRDFATQAWDKVRAKWEELGKKYGFVPARVRGIDKNTGEIIT